VKPNRERGSKGGAESPNKNDSNNLETSKPTRHLGIGRLQSAHRGQVWTVLDGLFVVIRRREVAGKYEKAWVRARLIRKMGVIPEGPTASLKGRVVTKNRGVWGFLWGGAVS